MFFVDYVEESIKTGRNKFLVQFLLSAGSHVPLPAIRKLVVEGRMLAAEQAKDYDRAEALFFDYVNSYSPSWGMTQRYLNHNVKSGFATRAEKILLSKNLRPDRKALILSAVKRSKGLLDEALAALDIESDHFETRKQMAQDRRAIYQQQHDHGSVASSVIEFLNSEPDRILIGMAISAAGSAEAVHREDIFSVAIARVLEDAEKVKSNPRLFKKHWREGVLGSLATYDIDGAVDIARRAQASGYRIQTVLTDALALRQSLEPSMHIIAEARRDILERAGVRKPIKRPAEAILVMPSAAMRSNKIDYPGFRSDILFCIQSIAAALESEEISFSVRSRIRLHGFIDFDVPYFSYHTASENTRGLHFKETDRRSLFSFDDRGYAGWSAFSKTPADAMNFAAVEQPLADHFFEHDKAVVTATRLSKYQQLETSESLPASFVFIGLQVIGDAVQSLAYQTPFAMMDEVVRTCQQEGIDVVVKRHPACKSGEIARYLSEQERLGNIAVATGNIHDIIPASLAVCVVNSGVGAEALMYEKPVFVFGRADYMGACFVCKHPGDFRNQFSRGETKLQVRELRKFWYLYRNVFSCDLTKSEQATNWIASRVKMHIASQLAIDN